MASELVTAIGGIGIATVTSMGTLIGVKAWSEHKNENGKTKKAKQEIDSQALAVVSESVAAIRESNEQIASSSKATANLASSVHELAQEVHAMQDAINRCPTNQPVTSVRG